MTYFRPQILDQLKLDGHWVIEASAGTGKTFTIEHLVVELLIRANARIDQILAVTFTERATAELRARIRAAIEQAFCASIEGDESFLKAYPDTARVRASLEAALFGFERAPIHTIHSFCQRMLTELAFNSGERFTTEAADGKALFHEAFRAVLREKPDADPDRAEALRDWLKENKNSVDNLETCLRDVNDQHWQIEPVDASLSIDTRVATLFLPPIRTWLEHEKFRRGVIDYDDMLRRLQNALLGDGGERLATLLRSRYRWAMIDEFQDTDEIQWSIFRKIFMDNAAPRALYVIGDPKQAIYSFRGADVHAYLHARAEITRGARRLVPLIENFRSTDAMILALNTILRQEDPQPLFTGAIKYDRPVSCGRKELSARVGKKKLVPITILRASNESRLGVTELRDRLGRQIARIIKEITTRPEAKITVNDGSVDRNAVTCGDIYILTDKNKEGVQLAAYLRAEGIPYAFYKRDGLFETDEAGDVLDVLRAVAMPNRRSYRMKAWATPFFSLTIGELGKIGEPAPSDPLVGLLVRWHRLAQDGDWGALFDSMIADSGLAARELFSASSLRELTNYEHILELLLEGAIHNAWTLEEVIDHLAAYIGKHGLPAGENTNVMRLEDERSAVQIMTIHKAKGLEARVIFVFGGMYAGTAAQSVKIFHDDNDERRLAIGRDAQIVHKEAIKTEENEEAQRLLYVAITRARAKLYLPFFPNGSASTLTGRYKQLNRRLQDMEDRNQLAPPLFEVVPIPESADNAGTGDSQTIAAWIPPQKLVDDPAGRLQTRELASLAHASAPPITFSYTSLRSTVAAQQVDFEPNDFKRDLDRIAGVHDEPRGGAAAGIFLHSALEKIDLNVLAAAPDLASWASRADVSELFDRALSAHQVPDSERWRARAPEIIFRTLRSPMNLGITTIPMLAGCESSREMEFTFPIPEPNHRLLKAQVAQAGDTRWRIERGAYVGFVDFVFRHDHRVYFADWKSDTLDSYEPAALEEHVRANYSLQAKIYLIGVLRLLGVHNQADYDARFGGLLYVFLRGVAKSEGRHGVYFHRPSWIEIVANEIDLMDPYNAAVAR